MAEAQAKSKGYGIGWEWNQGTIKPNGNTFSFSEDSSQAVVVTGDLLPYQESSNSQSSYSLGTSTNGWKELHVVTYYGKNGSSDERIKNSIEELPNKYEQFFDKMQPTRYKYNDGTSNRYHTGFIAQQLVKSLEESGLTTQDFAGVMLYHPGEEDECWYLRRDEFVALNTWQIQKLKARVKQDEETIELQDIYIKKLEERIEKLEQKLL